MRKRGEPIFILEDTFICLRQGPDHFLENLKGANVPNNEKKTPLPLLSTKKKWEGGCREENYSLESMGKGRRRLFTTEERV